VVSDCHHFTHLLNAKLFKVNSLPLVHTCNMIVEGAIVKHSTARWTAVLHGRRVHLLHVPLHTSFQGDCLSANHADEAVLALLHLSLHQQFQLGVPMS
jgi:hypothetical protein